MQRLNIKRKESKQGKIITTKLALDLDREQDIREIESKLRMQNLKIKRQKSNINQLNWITMANSQPGIKEELN
ncbi:MAG: hypothetical protein PHE49_10280 [bacterium]|nr:hypothetical protein [bacterium]